MSMIGHLLRWPLLPAFGAATISLLLYLFTAARTITWRNYGADGGELAATVMTLGVPHPPGYPTYLLLGRLSTSVFPFGDPAQRLILLSAFSGAIAIALIVVVASIILRPQRATDRFGLLLAGLGLGTAPLFWSQATIIEVYAPAAMGLAACLLLLTLRLQRNAKGGLLLPAVGLCIGISAGLHFQVLFLVLAVVPMAILMKPSMKELALAMLTLLLGLSVFLVLPLLAAGRPPIAWGDPTDLSGFFWTVSGTPYRSIVFGVSSSEIPQRAVGILSLLVRQFGPIGWLLAIWGAYRLWLQRESRQLLLPLGLLSAMSIVYTLGYNSVDFVVYLIPVLLATAVCVAVGTAFLLDLLLTAWRRAWVAPVAFSALLLAVPGLSLVTNYSSLDLSSDREALDYAVSVVQVAGVSPAIVLADSDQHVFSLWYHRYVYAPQASPDVVAGRLLQYRWYRDQLRRDLARDVLPPEPITYQDALDAFLSYASEEHSVYLTWEPVELLESYEIRTEGPLIQIIPSGGEGSDG